MNKNGVKDSKLSLIGSISLGTDAAAETANIILVNSNPHDIANLILFGKATYSKMIQICKHCLFLK